MTEMPITPLPQPMPVTTSATLLRPNTGLVRSAFLAVFEAVLARPMAATGAFGGSKTGAVQHATDGTQELQEDLDTLPVTATEPQHDGPSRMAVGVPDIRDDGFAGPDNEPLDIALSDVAQIPQAGFAANGNFPAVDDSKLALPLSVSHDLRGPVSFPAGQGSMGSDSRAGASLRRAGDQAHTTMPPDGMPFAPDRPIQGKPAAPDHVGTVPSNSGAALHVPLRDVASRQPHLASPAAKQTAPASPVGADTGMGEWPDQVEPSGTKQAGHDPFPKETGGATKGDSMLVPSPPTSGTGQPAGPHAGQAKAPDQQVNQPVLHVHAFSRQSGSEKPGPVSFAGAPQLAEQVFLHRLGEATAATPLSDPPPALVARQAVDAVAGQNHGWRDPVAVVSSVPDQARDAGLGRVDPRRMEPDLAANALAQSAKDSNAPSAVPPRPEPLDQTRLTDRPPPNLAASPQAAPDRLIPDQPAAATLQPQNAARNLTRDGAEFALNAAMADAAAPQQAIVILGHGPKPLAESPAPLVMPAAPEVTGVDGAPGNAEEMSQQTLTSGETIEGPRATPGEARADGRLQTSAPDFPRQVAQRLSDTPPEQAAKGIELRLSPEELGPLRLTLRNVDGHMTITVAVERPETLDLMRRHADQLLNDMRSLGYVSVRLDMQAQGDRRPSIPLRPQGDRHETAMAGPDSIISASPVPRLVSAGLDLRF